MRFRPDDVPGVVVVGVLGAVWGLGLARLLAEAGLQSLLYTSRVVVVLVALGCALVVVVLWRSSSPLARSSFPVALALPALYSFGVVADPLAGAALLIGGAGLTALGALRTVWQD
ncbi:MAG: hypothetical protein PVF04_05025, partial [Anaerolineae bacterium]